MKLEFGVAWIFLGLRSLLSVMCILFRQIKKYCYRFAISRGYLSQSSVFIAFTASFYYRWVFFICHIAIQIFLAMIDVNQS